MTEKIDFKKSLASYRARRGHFDLVEVADMQYLQIDGHGDPNTSAEYAQALEALYPIAYKLKFASKRQLGRDYVVPPLEGLWWADDMRSFTVARDKSRWHWRMMLMVPPWIDQAIFEAAHALVKATAAPARIDEVRLQLFSEGLSVQTLHVGSFDDEGPVLERMHAWIADQGLHLAGVHHEIYFSDARKVAPEKLRTLLRQPVTLPARVAPTVQ